MRNFLNSARVRTVAQTLKEWAIACAVGALIGGPAVLVVYLKG